MTAEIEGLTKRSQAHERAIAVLQKDMATITYDYVARVEMQLIVSKIQCAHRDIDHELADLLADQMMVMSKVEGGTL